MIKYRIGGKAKSACGAVVKSLEQIVVSLVLEEAAHHSGLIWKLWGICCLAPDFVV